MKDNLDIGDAFRFNGSFHDITPVTKYQWAFVDTASSTPAGDPLHGPFAGLQFYGVYLQWFAESPIAFWSINASYIADFNLANNFSRALLGKADYGLVVLPSSDRDGLPSFIFEALAFDKSIGEAFLASVNGQPAGFRSRWLSILGDPTLRENPLASPTNVQATASGQNVTVTWNTVQGTTNFVYRATSEQGPFELVGQASQSPWTGTGSYNSQKPFYMVRSAGICLTGRGSYWNPSAGTVDDARQ